MYLTYYKALLYIFFNFFNIIKKITVLYSYVNHLTSRNPVILNEYFGCYTVPDKNVYFSYKSSQMVHFKTMSGKKKIKESLLNIHLAEKGNT